MLEGLISRISPQEHCRKNIAAIFLTHSLCVALLLYSRRTRGAR